jgi:hypothetical protein
VLRVISLLAAASLCLALPVNADDVDSGGGTVNNSPPTLPTFASDTGLAQTRSTSGVFSGTARDLNGEVRVAQISISFITAPGGVTPTLFDHTVTAGDRAATVEPGSFGSDGFKVWNPTLLDGILSFKFQYTWGVNGAYTVRALVDDQLSLDVPAAADLSITISDGFTVALDPVLPNGNADTGQAWGGWAGIPGAANVDVSNYLKVVNAGSNPSQTFTMDFTPVSFLGADASTTLALNSNIKFDCQEASAGVAPNTLTFNLGGATASGSGSVTKSFTGLAKVYFCAYRLVALPNPLLDQGYTAAFTVS